MSYKPTVSPDSLYAEEVYTASECETLSVHQHARYYLAEMQRRAAQYLEYVEEMQKDAERYFGSLLNMDVDKFEGYDLEGQKSLLDGFSNSMQQVSPRMLRLLSNAMENNQYFEEAVRQAAVGYGQLAECQTEKLTVESVVQYKTLRKLAQEFDGRPGYVDKTNHTRVHFKTAATPVNEFMKQVTLLDGVESCHREGTTNDFTVVIRTNYDFITE